MVDTDFPPQRFNGGQQFTHVDGLNEIVVNPGFQSRNPAFRVTTGCNDNNAKLAVLTQVPQGGKPIFARKAQIDQDNMDRRH